MIILTLLFLAIFGFCFARYVITKNKSNDQNVYPQKTTLEKLNSNINARLSKLVEELTQSIKTPEEVEHEITNELDMFFSSKCNEAKSILNTYQKTLSICEKSKQLLIDNISAIEKRLQKAKERYSKANESERKNIANTIEHVISSKNKANERLEKTNQQILSINKKKQEIEDNIEIFVTNFNIKKADIINHIANIKSSSISNYDLNIDDLIHDLDMAINDINDNNKIENLFDSK